MVLLVSVIGVPLGLLVLYLYLLLLPLGYLASALAISSALLHRFRPHAERSLPGQALMLLAVLVGLAILISLPIAGKVLGAALVVLGMGCVALAVTELFRRPSKRQGRTASQPFSEPRPLTQGG